MSTVMLFNHSETDRKKARCKAGKGGISHSIPSWVQPNLRQLRWRLQLMGAR